MKKLFTGVVLILSAFFIFLAARQGHGQRTVEKSDSYEIYAEEFKTDLSGHMDENLNVCLEGISLSGFGYGLYMDENMQLMAPRDFLEDILNCSVVEYRDGTVLMEHGDTCITMEVDSATATVRAGQVTDEAAEAAGSETGQSLDEASEAAGSEAGQVADEAAEAAGSESGQVADEAAGAAGSESGQSADEAAAEDIDLVSAVVRGEDGSLFVPVTQLIRHVDFGITYSLSSSTVNFTATGDGSYLPASYDMRERGRVTAVRDQGRYGTCWAFASLGALETTLMPMEENIYSTDHMSLNNSYNLDLSAGGEHTMSIAYLAAWQGPVYEEDDVYGDGETDDTLEAVKHLEEAIVINERDDDVIKGAIYRYGGVETSLYLQMDYTDDYSRYYDEETASYYYDGDKKPNHDIVIVGWDDDYPKESFTREPEGDGAYICKNSWGEEFGDDGYFYVSYEDVNICNQSIVYTRLADSDNFDKIYQSDLLGWVGQMGFGTDSAYFANVYTAGENEELAAVSFYATGPGTAFSVYLVKDFKNEDSLTEREFIMSGETRYAGYYTAEFYEPVELDDNSDFAVVVYITTPNTERPIAIEYNVDERTAQVDITDGQGYISLYGEAWHSAEISQECNICLKAFTNISEEDE